MKSLKFPAKASDCPRFCANVSPEGVEYITWSPEHEAMDVVIETPGQPGKRTLAMEKLPHGFFRALDPQGRAGDRYGYSIDGKAPIPGPASRYQPDGVFGLSEVVDPSTYTWQAVDWKRPKFDGQVVYEVHIGTFTPSGTFREAIGKLDYLVELGVTALEIMPVGQWAGDRNWGYDGVYLYAPAFSYGTPDDMRAFVDQCHLRGLAVILDVVYNHLGPVGDFTDRFSKYFWLGSESSDWGCNFNVDGEQRGPVRAFLLQNLEYWMEDFRVDGFRLDATGSIQDESSKHIVAEMTELVHERGAFVVAEDHRNEAWIFEPIKKGGWDLDACWSNEFHHSARVSQTGEREAFYMSYQGTAEELADMLRHGWVYRGQINPRNGKPRGTESIHLAPQRLVHYLSTHDMAGNRTRGDRLHQIISGDAYRALSLLVCLIPYTPMLFMGQEWACASPFRFFSDIPEDTGYDVMAVRVKQFVEEGLNADDASLRAMLHPTDPEAFTSSKLNWSELAAAGHSGTLALYRDALGVRRRLFGHENPARETWSVASHGQAVEICYRLPIATMMVRYQMQAQDFVPPAGAISLLRSSDSKYRGQLGDAGPETFVYQLR